MVEPGRYMVADAGVLRSEVVLVSRRSPLDTERWVYLDCGKFHGLAETMDEAIRYRLRTPHDGGLTGHVGGIRAGLPDCRPRRGCGGRAHGAAHARREDRGRAEAALRAAALAAGSRA